MTSRYLNPFWREDQLMHSELPPDVCRARLKEAPAGRANFARPWFAGGDAAFSRQGYRLGSLLEVHVRVDVSSAPGNTSSLRLRFSAGTGSALLLLLAMVACLAVFFWTVATIVTTRAWDPIEGAGLLALLVPVFLVAALRAQTPDDMRALWTFVAEQVGGRPDS